MPIMEGDEKRLSIEELKEKANLIRGYVLLSTYCAGSGHPGGSLSIADIASALYFDKLNHKPSEPDWENRDKVIWSAGHKAPAFYATLGLSGYFNVEEVVSLRKIDSKFQGHADCLRLPGVEVSTGSLGQGLSVSIGCALAGKLDEKSYRVYCIMGDGEQQEGQIWEAAMFASHYKLDNLVGIVDKNKLQIDGAVKDVMNIEPLADKYKSFGWNVIEIDGHDLEQILEGFDKAKSVKGKPSVLIANTIKGKGVSFMENKVGWHGVAPDYGQMVQGLKELGVYNEIFSRELLEGVGNY